MDKNQPGVQLIESEEDKKKKEAQGAALRSMGAGTFSPTSGQATAAGPSYSTAARAQQATGGPRGSGFTGISRYLGANVGSRIGQTVAGGISAAGQQAQTRLGEAVGKFQTGLAGAQTGLTSAQTGFQSELGEIVSGRAPSVVGQVPAVVGAPSGAGGVSGATRVYTTPSVPDVSVVPPSQQPVKEKTKPGLEQPPKMGGTEAYRALTGAGDELKAPTGLEDLESAQQRAARAAQMAEATRTAGGRAALLQEAFGRGGRLYTRGQTALDALLLGKASKELAGARKEATGVQRQLRSEEKTAEEQIREFQTRKAAAAEEAKSSVMGAQKKLSFEIKGQKEQYEKELNRLTTNLIQELKGDELSEESAGILENLGLDPSSAQLYNVSKEDLASMIRSRALPDITEASSANLEQLQKINALRKLAGQEGVFTAEDLARAGQTAGKEAAIKGIGTAGEFSEILQKGREEYEQLLGSIIPGFKGYLEKGEESFIPGAKIFRSQADINAAINSGRLAQQNLPQIQQDVSYLNFAIKQLENVKPLSPEQKGRLESLKKQLNLKNDELNQNNAAIEKSKQAIDYSSKIAQTGMFEYSPGKGSSARNIELASRLYTGELFDPRTGELNTGLAEELSKFYDWRKQYTGRDGWFGPGQYARYAGDEARVEALKKLIAGAGKRLKVKGREMEDKRSRTPPRNY